MHFSMIVDVYSPQVRRHNGDTTIEYHCQNQANHTFPAHRTYYKIIQGILEIHLSTASQCVGYVCSCLANQEKSFK